MEARSALHRRHLFSRRQRIEQDMQREKDQTEPDSDAADGAGEAGTADPKYR